MIPGCPKFTASNVDSLVESVCSKDAGGKDRAMIDTSLSHARAYRGRLCQARPTTSRRASQQLTLTSNKFIFRRAPVRLPKNRLALRVQDCLIYFHEKKNY